MSLSVSPVSMISNIALSLVIKKRYSSIEEAVRILAITGIRNKMVYYRRRIRDLEKNMGQISMIFQND